MKSFRVYIAEADALRDRKVRLEGARVWNKFVKEYIIRGGARNTSDVPFSIRYGKFPIIGSRLAAPYDDLAITLLISKQSFGWGALFQEGVPNHITVLISGDVDFIPHPNNKYENTYDVDHGALVKELKKPQYLRLFVHEFTHYLDSKRMTTSMKGGGEWKGNTFTPTKEYYNSPHEFNAYFQESARDLDKRLKDITNHFNRNLKKESINKYSFIHELERLLPSNPNAFLKYIVNGAVGFDWKYHLNITYQKKFINRLYDYYIKIAVPIRNKIREKIEHLYNINFQDALRSDIDDLKGIFKTQSEMIDDVLLTSDPDRRRRIFDIITYNFYDFIKDWNSFRKAVLQHSMFFNNAKALVDPELINFPRIIENIYNKEVAPLGKVFKKHLNKLQ